MKRINSIVAAAAVLAGMAGVAQAGDFEGGYVGLYGTYDVNASPILETSIGGYGGYNFDLGNGMIVGGEADLNYDWASTWAGGGSVTTVMGNTRVGAEVADNLMVFGKGGVGVSSAVGGTFVWGVGAGAEYMVMDNVSMRGELERIDPSAAGLAPHYNLRLGLGYNF